MNVIPAALSGQSLTRITGSSGRPTKANLSRYLKAGMTPTLEFISLSGFHRPGAHFTLAEAVKFYGPVSVEIRHAANVLAVVEARESADGLSVVVR